MSTSVVQSNSGTSSGNATSISAALNSPSTANNLLVLVVGCAASATLTFPTGWNQDASQNGDGTHQIVFASFIDSSGGTSSVAISSSVNNGLTWAIYELAATNGWAATPLDQSATNFSTTSQTAFDSGTTSATTVASEMAIAGFNTGNSTGMSAPTNGFTLDGTQLSNGSPTTKEIIGYAHLSLSATQTVDAGVTNNTGAKYNAGVVTYAEASGGGTVIGSPTMGDAGGGIEPVPEPNAFTGSQGSGLLALSEALSAPIDLGNAGDGLSLPGPNAFMGAFGSVGGLVISSDELTDNLLMGALGGGLLVAGVVPLFAVMGGAGGLVATMPPRSAGATLGNVGTGLDISHDFVGNLPGQWVAVILHIWRPPGQWNSVVVKRWVGPAPGSWKTLSS